MDFRVLGPLEVVDGDQRLELGTPRQRAFLGLLLLHTNEPVSYHRLADQLWDGDPPAASTALADALALWRGPFMADLELAALDAERARLEAVRLTAVEDRIDANLALGHHPALVGELEALLTEDPFRERLWGQLMIAQYREGRQADALANFRRARQVLAEEIGVEPGRWLCRVQEQILLQDPSLDAPDRVPPADPHHNLPARRNTFVGRRREVAELEGLLRTHRLVTVTGPPGAGKTRLATEVGSRLVRAWPHGSFLVPLAELDDAGLVPSAITTALEVPRAGDEPVMQILVEYLRSRRLLLLLDNVEHVLDAAAAVAALLDAAPGLTVLATSRVRLRLDGEQEYPLGPLPLDRGDDATQRATHSDAVTLFADRAAAADPRFTIDADNAEAVADVVTRVDGLPLAIELAAARLRLFPIDELRRRLDPALDLLTDGVVERAERQRTLRAAIDWSHDLLDPPDRALLRRLAVFRSGITVEAAEAVAAGAPVVDVVSGLSRLIDASLLGRPADTDPPRVDCLETIRDFGLQQLRDAGEEEVTRERHAHFQAALVEEAAPRLTQVDQASWLRRLDAEHADLRTALRWAIDAGEADLAQQMATGLWRYWQLRGHLDEGRWWLETALDLTGATPASRARALLGLAGICYWQFDLDAAEAAYEQVRELVDELVDELDDWWIELEALFGQVVTLACHRGDLTEATALEEEFQALAAEHDDEMAMGLGLATSQMMRLLAGELDASRHYGEQCLAGTREIGERWYEVQVLRTLALTSLRQERHEHARGELLECLDIAAELGDLPGMAMDLDRLGQVAAIRGEPETACVLAGAAQRLRESVGSVVTPAAFRWEQEPVTETARQLLEETEIERALARGRTMTAEEAAAYGRERRPALPAN